jgi:hypothetical protein
MTQTRNALLAMILIGGAALAVFAGPGHEMKPYSGSKEFERIKSLAGHWEGTSTEADSKEAPQKAEADYRVTSGGSAVIETLFPGTPHEMVSVYHDQNGKLELTHYCMLGNHPNMQVKSASEKEIDLIVGKDGNVSPEETHMHELQLWMPAADQLSEKWVLFENGKATHSTTIALSRKS